MASSGVAWNPSRLNNRSAASTRPSRVRARRCARVGVRRVCRVARGIPLVSAYQRYPNCRDGQPDATRRRWMSTRVSVPRTGRKDPFGLARQGRQAVHDERGHGDDPARCVWAAARRLSRNGRARRSRDRLLCHPGRSSMTNNFASRAALQGTTNPRVSVPVGESNECPHVSTWTCA